MSVHGTGPAVLEERQARPEERRDRRGVVLDEGGIGELRRRVDRQLVREVEIVNDETAGQTVGVTWASR